MAKKVLITGKDSYVGTSFIKWMAVHEPETECVEISVRGEEWKQFDFSPFDSVLHVAGIAHVKETKTNKQSYYDINYVLAVDVGTKAKSEGVPHFILLSTMSVYGLTEGTIYKGTPLNPKTAYGESKLLAEKSINSLSDCTFQTTIIRPPMIYGPNCKGNYPLLSQLARRTPIFPKITNRRSMIFIENLCEFIRIAINNKIVGIYTPQNEDYVDTKNMVSEIAYQCNRKIHYSSFAAKVVTLLNFRILKKIFGDLVYSRELTEIDIEYNVVSFEESIKLTEEVTLKNV